MSEKGEKFLKILKIVAVISLILGVIFIGVSSDTTTYSTSEYWVAKDYHHVYDKYSGEIVDNISDNEKCEIDGGEIRVTKRERGLYTCGCISLCIFGLIAVSLLWCKISEKYDC